MSTINQDIIKGLKRSIEAAEEKIEELKKPSQKSTAHMRAAERDFWKKKVKVPQSVADWYEEHKDNLEYNIWDWMKYNLEPKKRENVIFSQWLAKTVNNPVETLIKMKLYGYEVEEEKRYYVRLKSVDENYNYLNYIKHLAAWCLTEIKTDKKFRTTHTRKQLEDGGFGEAFNSPLFEVEEVEE